MRRSSDYKVAIVIPFIAGQINELDLLLSSWSTYPPCGTDANYAAEAFLYFHRDLETSNDTSLRYRVKVW